MAKKPKKTPVWRQIANDVVRQGIHQTESGTPYLSFFPFNKTTRDCLLDNAGFIAEKIEVIVLFRKEEKLRNTGLRFGGECSRLQFNDRDAMVKSFSQERWQQPHHIHPSDYLRSRNYVCSVHSWRIDGVGIHDFVWTDRVI